MSSSKSQEQLAYELSCPICLQLFSDPVVLPCGHNYCWACIRKTAETTSTPTPTTTNTATNTTVNKSDQALPRCPECRKEYHGVGSLQKNFKLCSIIEGYRAAGPQLDMRAEGEPEEERSVVVYCDHCIDEQQPAMKTCLKCEVSLCSRHFQRHQEKESFKAHAVMDPAGGGEPGAKGCALHKSPLEYFCSNDMSLLCAACFIEGHHKNHDVLTFSVAEEEMRRALENRSKVISSRLLVTESLLQKTAEEQGASEAVGDKMISKAITLVDSMAALVDRYRGRLHVMFEEERGQRRKSWQVGLSELELQQQQLLEAQQSATGALDETDTYMFIHRFVQIEQRLREVVTSTMPSKLPPKAPVNTKRLQAVLKTQDFRSEMACFLDSLHVLLNPLDLSFSLVTAHPSLILSTDLRTVKHSPTKQSYPEHPERFTSVPQVLCSQGFSSGEHVWTVEVGAKSMWSLGVCYKSILRRGDHSRLGHNSVSWRLQWKNGKLTVCQASSNVALGELGSAPIRVEVALDYEGGTLMFHSTKARREHLHTFRAVFKEPVYPAFSILSNTPESWITLQSGM